MTLKNVFTISLLISILLSSTYIHAERIYVDQNATGNNNGKSWNNAFPLVQDALNDAQKGDEIWVAKGMYFPTDGADRSISFQLKEDVSIYGGFNGNEKKISQRNWEKNKTILSGNIGDKSINTDNSNHVVVSANNAILDGFIVEDGYALRDRSAKGERTQGTQQRQGRQSGGQRQGGGQPQTHTTPDAIIQSSQGSSGAGILNFKTSPTIRNTIVRNCTAGKGAGVYNMTNTSGRMQSTTPPPVFINVKIQNNYGQGRGGGMQNDLGTNPVLINCEFTDNKCDAKGGGLYNDFNCSPILVNCLFENNTAHDAAAMGNDGSSCPIIMGSKIINNTAESQGAGLYQGSYKASGKGLGNMPLVINSVIKNNTSTTNGIANIYNWGEDWVWSYNSEIKDFEHQLTSLDKKYDKLIEISKKIKSLDAIQIDDQYADAISDYINTNKSSGTRDRGRSGFGTDKQLVKSISIPQKVFYVSQNTKSGDGSSWNKAFNSIQQAIDAAHNGGSGQIWVAEGTYYPTNSSDRNISFKMKKGVVLFGGFLGNETKLTDRKSHENRTILSGNIGEKNVQTDNSYHVITGSTESIIDGFTISDGYADGVQTDRFGGGLYCWGDESSSIVKNCTFANNYAEDGGAVFCFNDVLAYFQQITFENNSAQIGGAASFRSGSSSELENCIFTNNQSSARAGAVNINYGSNVTIANSTFSGNKTDGNGGAIWVNDQASQYGGTRPVISNCKFSKNSASYIGGAIHNYNVATSIIQDCLFENNKAETGNDIANTLKSQVSISKIPDQTEVYTDETSRVQESSNFSQQTPRGSSTQKTSSQATKSGLENIDFSVTIIGSGSPQYNPNRSKPSALVQYKGVKFLVDMGDGTMNQLQKLGLSSRNGPIALLLTHHHIDHNSEFMDMVHSKFMSPGSFLVAGPAPIKEMTEFTAKIYEKDIDYRRSGRGKDFNPENHNATIKVLEGGEQFEYKGVKISTLEVPHTIKTIAYRFDAGGKSIVITGDLSYTDDLQKLAKNVDVIVIDGKIISERAASRNNSSNPGNRRSNSQSQSREDNTAHGSIDDIAKMATESGANTMVLTHLPPTEYSLEATQQRYLDLGFKGNVIVAEDFLTIIPGGKSFMLEVQPFDTQNNQNSKQSQSGNHSSNRSSQRQSQGAFNQERNNQQPAGGSPETAMQRLDTNGDGRISESEAKGPMKNAFSQIDANGDGFVTLEELRSRRGMSSASRRQ